MGRSFLHVEGRCVGFFRRSTAFVVEASSRMMYRMLRAMEAPFFAPLIACLARNEEIYGNPKASEPEKGERNMSSFQVILTNFIGRQIIRNWAIGNLKK